MTLAQYCLIFTDGFWGYLCNQKTTVGRIMDLRDASASKNVCVSRISKSAWQIIVSRLES